MSVGIVKSVFWNMEERRLRAGWRISCLFLLTLAASLASARLAESGSLSFFGFRIVYLILAALALWATVYCVDRRRSGTSGFETGPRFWRDLAFGFTAACMVTASVFLVSWGASQVRIESWSNSVTGFSFWAALAGQLALAGFAVSYEEALCRGYLIRNLAEGAHKPGRGSQGATVIALGVSALLFSLMHVGNPGMTALGFLHLLLLGGVLGWVYLATGSLAMPIGLHLGWNFALGNIFGFPVSGVATDVSIIALTETGHPLWTGGEFGPEAGFSGLLALGMLLFLVLVRLRRFSDSSHRQLEGAMSPSAR